ncbi:MAG: hypothetical protein ACTSRF_09380, partial [Candidatus Freyarchaeota archaeon]
KAKEQPLRKSIKDWGRNTLKFTGGGEWGWVSREAAWHSYYLLSSALYDEYFENHLLPQGGAYVYLQGLHGGPRDFSLFTIPTIYLDPGLAREMLEYGCSAAPSYTTGPLTTTFSCSGHSQSMFSPHATSDS